MPLRSLLATQHYRIIGTALHFLPKANTSALLYKFNLPPAQWTQRNSVFDVLLPAETN
jgi:hypothetical protein